MRPTQTSLYLVLHACFPIYALGWVTHVSTIRLNKQTANDMLSSFSLAATVYAPPWNMDHSSVNVEEESDEEKRFYEMFGVTETPLSMQTMTSTRLMSVLSSDASASLARLAVAFSTTGGLSLQDIHSVEVLDLHSDHMNIQAVVCEDDGCVTLHVPVQFPRPCLEGSLVDTSMNAFEECVLNNLGQLDVQATSLIHQQDYDDIHFEEVGAQRREKQLLASPNNYAAPIWWMEFENVNDHLRNECASIRRLLNEVDFEDDIRAMAIRAIAQTTLSHFDSNTTVVDQAAVAAVGPAGIIVRASTLAMRSAGDYDDLPPCRSILEVPIPFSSIEASVEGLREAVLKLVAAASSSED